MERIGETVPLRELRLGDLELGLESSNVLIGMRCHRGNHFTQNRPHMLHIAVVALRLARRKRSVLLWRSVILLDHEFDRRAM